MQMQPKKILTNLANGLSNMVIASGMVNFITLTKPTTLNLFTTKSQKTSLNFHIMKFADFQSNCRAILCSCFFVATFSQHQHNFQPFLCYYKTNKGSMSLGVLANSPTIRINHLHNKRRSVYAVLFVFCVQFSFCANCCAIISDCLYCSASIVLQNAAVGCISKTNFSNSSMLL